MSNRRDGEARGPRTADDMFMDSFLGKPTAESIKNATVGPFAQGNGVIEGFSARSSTPARFFREDDGQPVLPKRPPELAPAAPEPEPEKTAANASSPELAPGHPLPTTVSPTSNSSGSIVGLDVDDLAQPTPGNVTVGSAPSTGKRGPTPAPTAKAVSNQIMASIKGRRRPGPQSAPMPTAPGVPEGTAKKPSATSAADNPNRIEMSRGAGAAAIANTSKEKVAEVLRMVGAPPSLVNQSSVLWEAVVEKIAEVKAKTGDDAAYAARDDWHPFAMWTQLSSRYGDEWLSWDTEVIRDTIVADMGASPSDVNMNKIAALKLVTVNPTAFFNDWHVFEKVCLAFDGQAPRLTLVEDLTPEQMAMGLSCVRMVMAGQEPFSPALQKYCAARLFDAGFVMAPPELGFCDNELKKMTSADQSELRKEAMAVYVAALKGLDIPNAEDSPEMIQAGRLLRVHAYVLDRVDDVIRQVQ